eukprot:COSAG05_NODE_857_length_6940_cov_4.243385_12_plen_98_part_00
MSRRRRTQPRKGERHSQQDKAAPAASSHRLAGVPVRWALAVDLRAPFQTFLVVLDLVQLREDVRDRAELRLYGRRWLAPDLCGRLRVDNVGDEMEEQ